MNRNEWNILEAAHYSDDKLNKLVRDDSAFTDAAVRRICDIAKSCNPLLLLSSAAKLYGSSSLVVLYLQSLVSSEGGINPDRMDTMPRDRDVFQLVRHFLDMEERVRRITDCRMLLNFRKDGTTLTDKEIKAAAERNARRYFPVPMRNNEICRKSLRNTELLSIFQAVFANQRKADRIFEASDKLDCKDTLELYNLGSYYPDLNDLLIAPYTIEPGGGTAFFSSENDRGWLTNIPLEASVHPFIRYNGSYYCFVAPFLGDLMDSIAESENEHSGGFDIDRQISMIEKALTEEEQNEPFITQEASCSRDVSVPLQPESEPCAATQIRKVGAESDCEVRVTNDTGRTDNKFFMLERICTLLTGTDGQALTNFVSSSPSGLRDELEGALLQAAKAVVSDGRDKMLTIPGTDVTVVMCIKKPDQLRELQHRTNVAAVMSSNGQDSWHEVDVFVDSRGEIIRAEHIKVERNDFSQARWTQVTEMAGRLSARHK